MQALYTVFIFLVQIQLSCGLWRISLPATLRTGPVCGWWELSYPQQSYS